MKPENWYVNFGFSGTGSGSYGYYTNQPPRPPQPVKWPVQKPSYPQIQEGDHGMIIIRQQSIDFREKAVHDIVRQVEVRERQIGCRFRVTSENLPNGTLLVTWERNACAGVPGGPK